MMYDIQDYDAKYTIKLGTAVANGLELFDFETGLNEPLNSIFKDNFYYKYAPYEIGFSTWGEFKYNLIYEVKNKAQVYNKLYQLYTEQLASNPLINSKMITKNDFNSVVNQIVDSINKTRIQDTPQSKVTVLDDGYLSNVSDSKSDNTSDTISESGSLTEMSGMTEQEINLFVNYKNKIGNIIDELINDFRNLFMVIY